jgi:inorganic pyrophosphatase
VFGRPNTAAQQLPDCTGLRAVSRGGFAGGIEMNLLRLGAWDTESGALNVIIEAPKGSRNKLKYNPGQGLFELSKVLPRGMVFPFDFGFIPSTVGGHGDPIDVLVLLDEPVPAGCKIAARLVGVIEAAQTEEGKTERNDRLIAVAEHSFEHRGIHSLDDLSGRLVDEIEHIFVSYNEMFGKRYKPLARRGPREAETLVAQAAERFADEHEAGEGPARRERPPESPRGKARKRG